MIFPVGRNSCEKSSPVRCLWCVCSFVVRFTSTNQPPFTVFWPTHKRHTNPPSLFKESLLQVSLQLITTAPQFPLHIHPLPSSPSLSSEPSLSSSPFPRSSIITFSGKPFSSVSLRQYPRMFSLASTPLPRPRRPDSGEEAVQLCVSANRMHNVALSGAPLACLFTRVAAEEGKGVGPSLRLS